MSNAGFPILSLVIFLPLIGAFIVALITDVRCAKTVALSFAAAELIATAVVVYLFDAGIGNRFQLVEQHVWIAGLNIEYLIGVDGISVLFLPMSALLTLMALIASWNSVQHQVRLYFSLLLVLESATAGLFSALDMALFFLFWELTLPPIFFLISLWGIGSERRSAAIKYMLFMLVGGVPILFSIILLAVNHATVAGGNIPEQLSFSLPVLLDTPVPDKLQALIFLMLMLGFAVKAPLAPFHTWLPSVAMEGPTQMTTLLVGLKLGVFGIVRFAMPLAPSAAVQYNWVLGIFGAITLVYSALIALRQTNLRRLLAYSGVSHVGLVIVGIASLNLQGIQGALLQLLNFTMIAGSLMLIAGFIQHRLGSTEAIHLGGLARVMPRLTAFYFIFVMAAIGLPGTSGFPAELLLVVSIMLAHPGLSIAALIGMVLSAAYVLSFTRRTFLGPVTRSDVERLQDLRSREMALLCISALLVLAVGFYPNSVLTINKTTAESWLSRLMNQAMMGKIE